MRSKFNSDKSRLSQVYFSYFAILGVVSHYLGLYLHNLTLEPSMIGMILGIMTLGRIGGPTIWANLSWFKFNPTKSIQFSCFFALIFFSLLLFSHHPFILMLSLGGFAFFWSASLPQLESITQSCLHGDIRFRAGCRFHAAIVFYGYISFNRHHCRSGRIHICRIESGDAPCRWLD